MPAPWHWAQPKAVQHNVMAKTGHSKGLWAERVAELLLRAKGYRLLAHRFKTPVGEIDLIARKGKTLVFVEVKFRDSFEKGVYAILPAAQERIMRAAQLYLARQPEYALYNMRFDVVIVTGWRWPQHLKNVLQSR
jgi:putative endonuclease